MHEHSDADFGGWEIPGVAGPLIFSIRAGLLLFILMQKFDPNYIKRAMAVFHGRMRFRQTEEAALSYKRSILRTDYSL